MRRSAPQPPPGEADLAHRLYRQGLKVPSICNRLGGRYSIDTISRLVVPGYREKRAAAARERRKKNPAPSEVKRRAAVKPPAKSTEERRRKMAYGGLAVAIKAKTAAVQNPLPKEPEVAIEPLRVPLFEVPLGGCKFAVTPHSTAPDKHLFCGLPAGEGVSYCPNHKKITQGVKIGQSRPK